MKAEVGVGWGGAGHLHYTNSCAGKHPLVSGEHTPPDVFPQGCSPFPDPVPPLACGVGMCRARELSATPGVAPTRGAALTGPRHL